MSEDREQVMARAARANHLLQEPLLTQAFEAIERRWMDALRYSKLGSEGAATREHARHLLAALDELRAELTSHVTSGTVAREETEREQWREEFLRQDRARHGD